MFTGDLPHQHGAHAHSIDFTGISPSDTFVDDMSVERSIGISANHFASSVYGFNSFFDEFHDINPDVVHTEAWEDLDVSDTGGSKYFDAIRQAIESDHDTHEFFLNEIKRRSKDLLTGSPVPQLFDDGARQIASRIESVADSTEEPFFVFANIMDAHQPHERRISYKNPGSVPRSWNSSEQFYGKKWGINLEGAENHSTYLKRYRALYAASIEYMDRVISDMISRVNEATSRPTTYVVTADHGENLGYPSENGLFEHTSSLSEGVLHVPLNIINSSISPESLDYSRYFSHLDLGELLVALQQEADQFEVNRQPVAESIGISPGYDPLPEEKHEYWDRSIRAAFDGEQKYVWDSLGQKSVCGVERGRPNFQGESQRASTIPDRISSLFDCDIDDIKRSTTQNEGVQKNLDNKSKERLRDLGYL
jgi:arylsulfatase A-like enzyme